MNPEDINITYSDNLEPVFEWRPNEIPVTFDYHGEPFRGVLSSVQGAAAPTYYLHDLLNFYHGQLVYSEYLKQWQFTSQTGKFEDMQEYFVGLAAGGCGNNEYAVGVPFKYLHQLQNLWHSLTGSELQVNLTQTV